MKVLIYTHSFPPIIGGAQTYQYNLARELSGLGPQLYKISVTRLL